MYTSYIVKKSQLFSKAPTILVFLVAITVYPWILDSINIPKLFILVIGTVLVFVYSASNIDFREKFKEHKILISLIFGAFVSMTCSALLNPQNLYSDLIGTWRRNNGFLAFISTILLFLTVVFLDNKFSAYFAIRCLSWLGAIFGIYSWFQINGSDPLTHLFPWYNSEDVLALTFGNSNFASVFLGFTFTGSLGYLFVFRGSNYVRAFLLISVINQWIIVRYLDTQGKIIYAFGASIVIGIWLISSASQKIKNIGKLWILVSTSSGILGAMGLFGIGPFAGMLENNIVNLKDRYYHWIAAYNMLRSNIFVGVGIDSFGDFHRQYRILDSIRLRGTASSSTDNAHNVFLQLGATIGFPFLFFYVLLVCYVTFCGIRKLISNNNKVMYGTLFAIWVSYLVQSLISVDQLGISSWGWLAAGAVVSRAQNNEKIEKGISSLESNLINKIRFRVVALTTLPILAMSLVLFSSLVNEIKVFNYWQKLGNSVTQVDAELNAKRLLSDSLTSNQPKLRVFIADTLGKSGFIEEALILAKATTDKFPREYAAWDIVASVNELNGYPDRAIQSRKKTVELDPLNEEIKLKLEEDSALVLRN